MGNCLSSPEAKEKITGLEAEAKAKGTQFLQQKEGALQGTGTTGTATAQPTSTGAGGAGGAPAGGAGGVEGKLENAARSEAPKLEQMAQNDLTGAGGAATGAGTSAAATPAAT